MATVQRRREERRPPPQLLISVPFEGKAVIRLAAWSAEDEHRLRRWLRRSRELDCLADVLVHLLDALDELDEAA